MAAPTDQMLMLSVLGREGVPEYEFAGKEASEEDLAVVMGLFGKKRRWRFDYAWPEKRVAWEVDGGSWIGGRHSHGTGFEKDIEKMNTATRLGWSVIRSTPSTKSRSAALEFIKSLLHD